MKSSFLTCPYRNLSGIGCYHKYSRKIEKTNGKKGTICDYADDNMKCPLYKLWLEKLDKQLENDEKKKRKISSKKMPRV